jgi:hypothetical protein
VTADESCDETEDWLLTPRRLPEFPDISITKPTIHASPAYDFQQVWDLDMIDKH